MEFAKPVPESVKSKIGYNIEKTLKLLRENWTPRQRELLQLRFDPALAKVLSFEPLSTSIALEQPLSIR
jgi:mannosylglycerate synthase